MDDDDDQAYGTAPRTAPVTRADLERAIRGLHIRDTDIRDTVLQLAARVVALTDELTRRLDGVEPQPAPPNTPAAAPTTTLEGAVEQRTAETLQQIRAADVHGNWRVSLDTSTEDKYSVAGASPPCDELLHLCEARCCSLTFTLSTADLDEGVIRWDYGRPYVIRQRASDRYCVHNDPATRGCTVHAYRPRTCRTYDCRSDARIWLDYDKRIPAPPGTRPPSSGARPTFDLIERARERQAAEFIETCAVHDSYPDAEPVRGPAPPKKP